MKFKMSFIYETTNMDDASLIERWMKWVEAQKHIITHGSISDMDMIEIKETETKD